MLRTSATDRPLKRSASAMTPPARGCKPLVQRREDNAHRRTRQTLTACGNTSILRAPSPPWQAPEQAAGKRAEPGGAVHHPVGPRTYTVVTQLPQYLRDLNPQQREAAMTTEGPVLILAGAGSGKTRTLVYRIVHLLDRGVDPRRILAVTFTNRAANEMRDRIAGVVDRSVRALTVSTFHSLGARILRQYAPRVDLPKQFAIYATGDQLGLIRRILGEEVHVVATAGDDVYDAKRVLHRISGWKNQMVDPEEAAREVAAGRMRGNRTDDYDVLAAAVYPRYE